MKRKKIMGALKKARLEEQVALSWFDGAVTEEAAKNYSRDMGLSLSMVEYHYGKAHHKQERASHGFN